MENFWIKLDLYRVKCPEYLVHDLIVTRLGLEFEQSGFGSFNVLWLRGIAPPQDIGPGPGASKRFTVSTNYDARIKR